MPQYSTRAQNSRKDHISISKSVREAVFAESAGCCVYCGWIAEVLDHVIPRSYGGTDERYNLVAACRLCNNIASDKIFDDVGLKRDFILTELRRSKYIRRKQLNFCAECGDLFRQNWEGSTRVLCDVCNTADLALKTPSKKERKETLRQLNRTLQERAVDYTV